MLFDVLSTVLTSVSVSPTSSRVWSVVVAILDVSLLYAGQYSGILQAGQPISASFGVHLQIRCLQPQGKRALVLFKPITYACHLFFLTDGTDSIPASL